MDNLLLNLGMYISSSVLFIVMAFIPIGTLVFISILLRTD